MKDAYRIDELVELGPLGRTLLYRAIGERRLRTRKYGRRRYVLRDDWLAFLRQEPPCDARGELMTDDLAEGHNDAPLRPSCESLLSAEVESRVGRAMAPTQIKNGDGQSQRSNLADSLKGKLGRRETGFE